MDERTGWLSIQDAPPAAYVHANIMNMQDGWSWFDLWLIRVVGEREFHSPCSSGPAVPRLFSFSSNFLCQIQVQVRPAYGMSDAVQPTSQKLYRQSE